MDHMGTATSRVSPPMLRPVFAALMAELTPRVGCSAKRTAAHGAHCSRHDLDERVKSVQANRGIQVAQVDGRRLKGEHAAARTRRTDQR